MAYRKIAVPTGIGDSVWLLQKLINQTEKFDFIIPGQNPRRGKQVFDLLPTLANSAEYSSDPALKYKTIKDYNVQKRTTFWYHIKDTSMNLSANEWLEEGKWLRDFLPDLEISYTLPWETEKYKSEVELDLKNFEYCIGIYGSSYSTSRAWGFWQEDKWFELIKKIHEINPKITFCIIGAEWDINLSTGLIGLLNTDTSISYHNTVGKPLGYVMEMMKKLDYAFYFPSGLPIISESLDSKTDCVMFYPPSLIKMQGKWCDPERTKNSNFKECQFCEPQKIFDWVKDTYKLFDRL